MNRLRCYFGAAALVVSLLVSSCVTVEKGYPDKRYFVIAPEQPVKPANPTMDGVLVVSRLRVSPRYEGKSFVYRLSASKYEQDFYNQFLVAPGAILTEEIRHGLAKAQVFRSVLTSASQVDPTHVLEGTLDALYGDFRDTNGAKAVLEMEFFLAKESATNAEIVTQKRYSKSIPVKERTPEALVAGWNQALSEILAALVSDLKAARL